ncbi:hypothetical protein SAMN04515671_3555 [Nakamurella panacisegetis]|uniref:Uncharacterized protein n=1 Tax=Nakamurella panacisegetis TaxID=1090615 RepID=A0A1H0RHY9_9ACTN|nr:hypothetical protein [Nakamurella panacisegetis]SDP28518.1 hypothetical protein SAMN04515671_3555 [Nakamurella panacisegetis]
MNLDGAAKSIPDGEGRWPIVEIRRNAVVRFLYSSGLVRLAGRAQRELPARFDSEQQQQVLRDLGVDAATVQRAFPTPPQIVRSAVPRPRPSFDKQATASAPLGPPPDEAASAGIQTTAATFTSAADEDLTARALRSWLAESPTATRPTERGVPARISGTEAIQAG